MPHTQLLLTWHLGALDELDALLNLGDELGEHGLECRLLVLGEVAEAVDLLHTCVVRGQSHATWVWDRHE